jgi:hypothetical protein
MENIPSSRSQKLLTYLQKTGSASFQELAAEFSVSVMTIHRDINALVSAGLVHKRHGEVMIAGETSLLPNEKPCAMCGKSTQNSRAFIVYLANGNQRRTCCAHCGLMHFATSKDAAHAMATDFLHNQIISADKAIYLSGAEISDCCVPSILAFGSQREAELFQTGFGGKLSGLDGILNVITGTVQNKSSS